MEDILGGSIDDQDFSQIVQNSGLDAKLQNVAIALWGKLNRIEQRLKGSESEKLDVNTGFSPSSSKDETNCLQKIQQLLTSLGIEQQKEKKELRKTTNCYYGSNEPAKSLDKLYKYIIEGTQYKDSVIDMMLPIIFPGTCAPKYLKAHRELIEKNRKELSSIFLLLHRDKLKGEKKFVEQHVQEMLESNWLECLASSSTSSAFASVAELDCCISNRNDALSPSPLFPKGDKDINNKIIYQYSYSGKPNIASTRVPMYLEMKESSAKFLVDSTLKELSELVAVDNIDTTKHATAKNANLALENLECIYQALQRVLGLAYLNDLVKVVITIATCGLMTRCIVMKKSYEGKKITESFYFFPMDYSDIIPFWRTVHELYKENHHLFFRMNESIMIHRTLFNIFPSHPIDASFCRIKLISQPRSSSVYQIFFYFRDKHPPLPYIVDARNNLRSIVIKLPHVNSVIRHLNELNILRTIRNLPASDYVIGIQDFQLEDEYSLHKPDGKYLALRLKGREFDNFIDGDGVEELLLNHFQLHDETSMPNYIDKFLMDFKSVEDVFTLAKNCAQLTSKKDVKMTAQVTFLNCWWMRFAFSPLQPSDFVEEARQIGPKTTLGAIVMFPGEIFRKFTLEDARPILPQILTPLYEHGVFHSDIRPPNLLSFPNLPEGLRSAEEKITTKIRLIDFDLAVMKEPQNDYALIKNLHQQPGARRKMILATLKGVDAKKLTQEMEEDELQKRNNEIEWTIASEYATLTDTVHEIIRNTIAAQRPKVKEEKKVGDRQEETQLQGGHQESIVGRKRTYSRISVYSSE